METWYNEDGAVVLAVEDNELHMSREEAESLFVMLGHTLQDMDLNGPFDNASEGEQPNGSS